MVETKQKQWLAFWNTLDYGDKDGLKSAFETGWDAAQSALAERVLAVAKREVDYYEGMTTTEYGDGGRDKAKSMFAALRALFEKEGITVDG